MDLTVFFQFSDRQVEWCTRMLMWWPSMKFQDLGKICYHHGWRCTFRMDFLMRYWAGRIMPMVHWVKLMILTEWQKTTYLEANTTNPCLLQPALLPADEIKRRDPERINNRCWWVGTVFLKTALTCRYTHLYALRYVVIWCYWLQRFPSLLCRDEDNSSSILQPDNPCVATLASPLSHQFKVLGALNVLGESIRPLRKNKLNIHEETRTR